MSRVHYPGLPSHPDHAIAMEQMTGFGGVVSFEVRLHFSRYLLIHGACQAIGCARRPLMVGEVPPAAGPLSSCSKSMPFSRVPWCVLGRPVAVIRAGGSSLGGGGLET